MPAQSLTYADAADLLGAPNSGNDEAQWASQPLWEPPVDFEDAEGEDLGVRFGDVNGDGRPDLIRAYENADGTGVHEVYLGSGGGWSSVKDDAWSARLSEITYTARKIKLFDRSSSSGPLFCDLTHSTYANQVYFADGRPPGELTPGSHEHAPAPSWRVVDLNDDGLADLVSAYAIGEAYRHYNCGAFQDPKHYPPQMVGEVWINTGDSSPAGGWVRDASLSDSVPPFVSLVLGNFHSSCPASDGCFHLFDLAPRFIELNDDGRPDLVTLALSVWYQTNPFSGPLYHKFHSSAQAWMNAASGWTRAASLDPPVKQWRAHEIFQPVNCDAGVRLADLNRDGLTDIVAARDASACVEDPEQPGFGAAAGVWLNTGNGWCASSAGCPDASRYTPPELFVGADEEPTELALDDLNGDGWLDLIRTDASETGGLNAWLHDPGADPVWVADNRFKPPVELATEDADGSTGVRLLDADSDGIADLVRAQEQDPASERAARVGQSGTSDLLSSHDNGQGGVVEWEYTSALAQQAGAVLFAALTDFNAHPLDPCVDPLTELCQDAGVERWRPQTVVSLVRLRDTITGIDSESSYHYGMPRWSEARRVSLGYRVVRTIRPDLSAVWSYFFQAIGRAGRLSRREIHDGGELIHQTTAEWSIQEGDGIGGSMAGVWVGRLESRTARAMYDGEPGATQTTTLAYGDEVSSSHPGYGSGFDFVAQATFDRPAGSFVVIREPEPFDPATDPWLPARMRKEWRWNEDQTVELSRRELSYHPTGEVHLRTDWAWPRGQDFDTTDPAPEPITQEFLYDAYGNLAVLYDPDGRRVDLCYDGDSILGTGVTCPSPPGQATHSVLVGTRDPLEGVTSFEADATAGWVVQQTRWNGDVIQTDRDPFGRVTDRWITPTGYASSVHLEHTDYHDAVGSSVESFAFETETDPVGIRRTVFLDGFGGARRLVDEVPPASGTAEIRYRGTLVQIDPVARTLRQTYSQECGLDADCATLTGAETPATLTTFDALGRVARVDSPDGFALRRYFREQRTQPAGPGLGDAFDAELVKTPGGALVQRVFDGDRLVWVDECANTPDPGLDPATFAITTCLSPDRTFYTYEATGEVAAIYDATETYNDPNHVLRYGYDTLGRVLEVYDPDKEPANPGDPTTEMVYDATGNVISTTNARGQTTVFAYADPLHRLTSIDRPGTEPDVTLTYDVATRQVDVVTEGGAGEGYLEDFDYDVFGRVARDSLTVKSPTPDVTLVGELDYDLIGRATEIRYPDLDTVIQYAYAGAYLTRVCEPGDGMDCASAETVDYVGSVEYQGLGRPAKMVLPGGQRSYTYDPQTYQLQQDRFDANLSSGFLERNYSYDEAGNIVAVIGTSYGEGQTDPVVDRSYTYDHRGRVASWTYDGVTEDFLYDPLGNLIQHGNDAGGAPITQAYDDPARPHAIQSRSTGETYSYDADGNLASILGPAGARHFTFDSVGRLRRVGTTAGGSDLLEASYDVSGARVVEQTGSGSATRIYFGELFEYDVETGVGRAWIFAHGKRIAFKHMDEVTLRTSGLLACFDLIPGEPWIVYVPVGGGVTLLLVLFAFGILAPPRRPAHAALAMGLVVLIAVPPPLQAGGPTTGAVYHRWLIDDPIASSSLVIDDQGIRVNRFIFAPFGRVKAQYAFETFDPIFATHELEDSIDLYYMKARWYDATSGRFASLDPLLPQLADPQSHNPYSYALNNPTSLIDPTGACTEAVGTCPKPIDEIVVTAQAGSGFQPGGSIFSHPLPSGNSRVDIPPGTTSIRVVFPDGTSVTVPIDDERVAEVAGQNVEVIDQRSGQQAFIWPEAAPVLAGEGVRRGLGAILAAPFAAAAAFLATLLYPSELGDGTRPVHSIYGDGTLVFEGEQPPRLPRSIPGTGAPQSLVRFDALHGRVYQLREFDAAGNPVRDIDFTNPTFPNGVPRPGHPGPPHQHLFTVNDPRVGPRSGFVRGGPIPLP